MITTRPGDQTPALDPAVPPLDDELAGVLDDLAGVHPGIDLIRDGIRLLALDRHSIDKTKTIVGSLAAIDDLDVITAVGLLVARITNAETNPCLRTLPLDQQKQARRFGELTAFNLADPDLHQTAAEAVAVIDGV